MVSMMVCRSAPADHLNMRPAPCSTATLDCGVTVVSPREKALGWLTFWLSEITTLSEPCVTAAGRTDTPWAITTVPVRELKMILGRSSPTPTRRASSWATKATRCVGLAGACTSTLVASSVVAMGPNLRLMVSTMLVAVWKLGRLRLRRTLGRALKSVSISRSMLAPLGMRPEVGVLTVTLEPLLPCAERPPTTRFPWASA